MFRKIIELPVHLLGLSSEPEPNPAPVPEGEHDYLPWIVVSATFVVSAYTFLNAFYPILWNQLGNLRIEDEENGVDLVNEQPLGEKEEHKEEFVIEEVMDPVISWGSGLFLGKLPLQTMFVEYTKACRENRDARHVQLGEFELPFFNPANAMHPEDRPHLILNMQKALGLVDENGDPKQITEAQASNVRRAFGYLG